MIYKVCSVELWNAARQANSFAGAEVDLQDGFIHFSTAHQLRETLQKHFAGQSDLVLLSVDESKLGADLRWEKSRGGDLFPHLYAPLPIAAVVSEHPISMVDRNVDPLAGLPEFPVS